jgi:hypothetical protein
MRISGRGNNDLANRELAFALSEVWVVAYGNRHHHSTRPPIFPV